MSHLRGLIRITLAFLLILAGTTLVLTTAWLPYKRQGVTISAWPTTLIARLLLKLFNVHPTITETARLRQHHGFIFPNHLSFLDIFLLTSIVPMRYLSKSDIKQIPLIGWVAVAIDTVFVDRSNKSSREAARQALSQTGYYPPVVLFPEGGIFPPAGELKPFRYGAFEIAAAGSVPFIPCVIRYDPLEVAFWGDETLGQSIWRLACNGRPIHVHLHPLKTITPTHTDDPRTLALETHGAMSAILKYYGHEDDILSSGL